MPHALQYFGPLFILLWVEEVHRLSLSQVLLDPANIFGAASALIFTRGPDQSNWGVRPAVWIALCVAASRRLFLGDTVCVVARRLKKG